MEKIGLLIISLFILGCSDKPEIAGWVSIEKPPIKVVYVVRDKMITPETVRALIGQVSLLPYEDYMFNSSVTIGISNQEQISEDLSQTTSDSLDVSDN
jgi:hypothetical protein